MTDFLARVESVLQSHCQHNATKAGPRNTRVCCSCGAEVQESPEHDEFYPRERRTETYEQWCERECV